MKKLKTLFKISLFVPALALFVSATPIHPQTAFAGECRNQDALLGIRPWYSDLCKAGTNDIQVGDDAPNFVTKLLLNILSIALQIAGYVAVGFVIWGGIKYMLSNGDSGKTASAKTIIQNALIGLLIVLAAVAIETFVYGLYT